MRYRLTPTDGPPSPSEPITFTTRTGTRRGVTAAQWRVETPRDLATWSRGVVQATHAAVADMQQLVFGGCRRAGEWGGGAGGWPAYGWRKRVSQNGLWIRVTTCAFGCYVRM